MFDFYIPIAVVLAVGSILCCCWRFRPSQAQTVRSVAIMLGQEPPGVQIMIQAQQQQEEKPKGLDKETIDSYPTVVVGERHQRVNHDDNTCPICLIEYKPENTLKILPHCLHKFHVECLDEWLRSNPTCPVCRIQLPSLHSSAS